jgi:hypothetical protein
MCCDQLCRQMLSFEVQMQRGTNKDNAAPTVKVKVHKEGATATEKQDILIETFEFERGLATVKDEVRWSSALCVLVCGLRLAFCVRTDGHTHGRKRSWMDQPARLRFLLCVAAVPTMVLRREMLRSNVVELAGIRPSELAS